MFALKKKQSRGNLIVYLNPPTPAIPQLAGDQFLQHRQEWEKTKYTNI